MPTFEFADEFSKDMQDIDRRDQKRFRQVVLSQFVPDLANGRQFRNGLRVKGVHSAPGVFEMRWASDGRATFQYGDPLRGRDPHVIWRRVGSHDILRSP